MAIFTNNPEDDFRALMQEIDILKSQIKTMQSLIDTLNGYFSDVITGETTKYVASSSGGAVTDEIKFTNGILTQS